MGRKTRTDDYYQFPLCLLTLPLTEKDLVQHIISHVLVAKGAIIRDKMNENAEYVPGYEILTENREDLGLTRMEEIVLTLRNQDRLPEDFEASDSNHLAIAAMVFTHKGICVGSCEGTVDRYEHCRRHVFKLAEVMGRDVEVRIRYDILWQLDNNQISMREFRIMAGVYAGLGNKPYGSVTLKRLRYLSAGLKSEQAFDHVSSLLEYERDLFSEDKIRKTRDDLVRLGFIHSFYDGRRCWYSNRMTAEEIMEHRVKTKEHKLRTEIKKQRLRATARERLHALEAELASSKRRLAQARSHRKRPRSTPSVSSSSELTNEEGANFHQN